MIINAFKLTNISMFHHDSKELDNNFGCRSNEDLSFTSSFSIYNAFQTIVQNADSDHDDYLMKDVRENMIR